MTKFVASGDWWRHVVSSCVSVGLAWQISDEPIFGWTTERIKKSTVPYIIHSLIIASGCYLLICQ